MSLAAAALIVLVLVLFGTLPTWPHSAGWGYLPSGVLGVTLMVAVAGLLMRVL